MGYLALTINLIYTFFNYYVNLIQSEYNKFISLHSPYDFYAAE